MSVAQCAPIGGGGGASKIFGPDVEKQIADERKLLAPVIPPGAVVLSEAGPIAYYLDGVISGARRAPAPLATRRAAAADTPSVNQQPVTVRGLMRTRCLPGCRHGDRALDLHRVEPAWSRPRE